MPRNRTQSVKNILPKDFITKSKTNSEYQCSSKINFELYPINKFKSLHLQSIFELWIHKTFSIVLLRAGTTTDRKSVILNGSPGKLLMSP